MNKVPHFKQAFAQVLREHREQKSLTQSGLAEVIGGSEIYIRTLEKGKANPTTPTLILLAQALDLDPVVLLEEVLNRIKFLKLKQ